MTDSDLRELDGWIEQHLFGREVIREEREGLPTAHKFKLEHAPDYVPVHAYSTSVVSFALVKREIERRGWRWISSFGVDYDGNWRYWFSIYSSDQVDTREVWASSEELAGCLAVKAAVEGSE